MTNKTLFKGSIQSTDVELIYTCPVTTASCNLLPLLIVNRSNNDLRIRVYFDSSANLGGALIEVPAGDGVWRHMVGIPMGISQSESISIQSETTDRFDVHLAGSEF